MLGTFLKSFDTIISEKPLAPPCWRRCAFHTGNVTTVHCNRKKTAGALLLKEKTFCGTPLVAGTHGPTMLVAVCKTRLEPESGYKITTCPPADAMLTGGILLPDEPVISLRQTGRRICCILHCFTARSKCDKSAVGWWRSDRSGETNWSSCCW